MRLSVWILIVTVSSMALAAAETYLVTPDGTGDFPTIQLAIEASRDGDVIELTDGVFTGDGNRDIDYLGRAITVRSQHGDPGTCVIDCEGSAAERHRGFHFHSGEGGGAVLAGVTIANGYVAGEWPDDCGAAILCLDGSSPSFENCVFAGNMSVGGDGGAILAHSSSPTLLNCVFAGNSADSGGAVYWEVEQIRHWSSAQCSATRQGPEAPCT